MSSIRDSSKILSTPSPNPAVTSFSKKNIANTHTTHRQNHRQTDKQMYLVDLTTSSLILKFFSMLILGKVMLDVPRMILVM